MEKEFKKSDLRTGMLVELRDKTILSVIKGVETQYFAGDVFVNNEFDRWLMLENYTDDLCNITSVYDVMKIYISYHPYCVQDPFRELENANLIWERYESKK